MSQLLKWTFFDIILRKWSTRFLFTKMVYKIAPPYNERHMLIDEHDFDICYNRAQKTTQKYKYQTHKTTAHKRTTQRSKSQIHKIQIASAQLTIYILCAWFYKNKNNLKPQKSKFMRTSAQSLHLIFFASNFIKRK